MAKTKRLEQLEKKRDQLNAHIQRERNKQQAQKRKDDNRRMILIGRMVMREAERDEDTKSRLRSRLDRYLDRDRDRELFGLAPRENGAQ